MEGANRYVDKSKLMDETTGDKIEEQLKHMRDVLFDPFFEIIINIEPGGKWIDGAKRIFQDLFETTTVVNADIYKSNFNYMNDYLGDDKYVKKPRTKPEPEVVNRPLTQIQALGEVPGKTMRKWSHPCRFRR
jgi:hypothetical protein